MNAPKPDPQVQARLLLVDDDRALCEVMGRAFRARGFDRPFDQVAFQLAIDDAKGFADNLERGDRQPDRGIIPRRNAAQRRGHLAAPCCILACQFDRCCRARCAAFNRSLRRQPDGGLRVAWGAGLHNLVAAKA